MANWSERDDLMAFIFLLIAVGFTWISMKVKWMGPRYGKRVFDATIDIFLLLLSLLFIVYSVAVYANLVGIDFEIRFWTAFIFIDLAVEYLWVSSTGACMEKVESRMPSFNECEGIEIGCGEIDWSKRANLFLMAFLNWYRSALDWWMK